MKNKPDDELCAKCGYTYDGHVSNTGVLYPCWTPSGRYAEPKPAAAPTPPAPRSPLAPHREPTSYERTDD